MNTSDSRLNKFAAVPLKVNGDVFAIEQQLPIYLPTIHSSALVMLFVLAVLDVVELFA